MQITEEGFGALTSELMTLAHEFSKDRILFTLEGGYDLQGLREGVKQVLFHLGGKGKKPEIGKETSPNTEKELAPVLKPRNNSGNFRDVPICHLLSPSSDIRHLIRKKKGPGPFLYDYKGQSPKKGPVPFFLHTSSYKDIIFPLVL